MPMVKFVGYVLMFTAMVAAMIESHYWLALLYAFLCHGLLPDIQEE